MNDPKHPPQGTIIEEEDEYVAEELISGTELILEVLGYDVFKKKQTELLYGLNDTEVKDDGDALSEASGATIKLNIEDKILSDLFCKNWRKKHSAACEILKRANYLDYANSNRTIAKYHDEDGTNYYWADASIDATKTNIDKQVKLNFANYVVNTIEY